MQNTFEFMEQYLDDSQVRDFREAQEFLSEPVPINKDAKGKAWATTNLQFQNTMDSIKVTLSFIMTTKKSVLFTTKQEMMMEAKEEGMKSVSEREAYCYSSPKYIVMNTEFEKLQAVYDRVNSLSWVLKSQLSLLN